MPRVNTDGLQSPMMPGAIMHNSPMNNVSSFTAIVIFVLSATCNVHVFPSAIDNVSTEQTDV